MNSATNMNTVCQGKMVRQNQRQRTRHEARQAVGLHMNSVAQTKLQVGQ